ncbi:MAG: thymidylate synthase [Thermodesulfovibrionales bacterium]|nr:thymidylate synthase [Thermodesulfovibrionales bacterium]
MTMVPFFIHAKTISDAWFQLIYNLFDHAYEQKIQHGSFEGEQYRLQYPGMAVYIELPHLDIVPVMPPGSNIPPPTSMEYIENYFANYLMNPELEENETYRYSSRIHHPMPKGGTQFDRVVRMLKETPLTNQAVIEIATPEDLDTCFGNDGKLDPPCLRLIDFKAVPTKEGLTLTVSVYFRSWDLWAGFPTNLGGIELLKQYIAQEAGLENGSMYAYSAGAHIYGYQEELARLRTLRTGK